MTHDVEVCQKNLKHARTVDTKYINTKLLSGKQSTKYMNY